MAALPAIPAPAVIPPDIQYSDSPALNDAGLTDYHTKDTKEGNSIFNQGNSSHTHHPSTVNQGTSTWS
jgi:hypothetical protein